MAWMTGIWNRTAGIVGAGPGGIPGPFQNRALHQITIPGTHDAGCSVNYGWFSPGWNQLSRTQLQDIGGQLNGGIRYFDIRPAFSNGQYWTYHGAYWGQRIDGMGNILNQVANYLNGLAPAGPNYELVILNISHFYQFTNPDHTNLIAAITNILGGGGGGVNYLVPYTQAQINLFNAPYWQLLTDPPAMGAPALAGPGLGTRSRVAILYDGALDTGREGYITTAVGGGGGGGGIAPLPAGFFTLTPKYAAPGGNAIQLFDQYARSASLTTMRADQLAKLNRRAGRPISTQAWAAGVAPWANNAVGGVASMLHLFSWTLTPQIGIPPTDPINASATSNPALPNVFSDNVIDANGNVIALPVTYWGAPNPRPYDPGLDPKINIVYVDNYASQTYASPLPGSPYNALAMPVAIAARLNEGSIWPMNW